MKTIFIIKKPLYNDTSSATSEASSEEFKIPNKIITNTTSIKEIREYQEIVLDIMKRYKNFMPNDKKINKIVQKIIELFSDLLLAFEKKDKKNIIKISADLHNMIEMFNITGTFDSSIDSISDEKLKIVMIHRILELVTP